MGKLGQRELSNTLHWSEDLMSWFAHLEKSGAPSFVICVNLLHPWSSLFLRGLKLYLWCFSIFVNYYFRVFFYLKVILFQSRITWPFKPLVFEIGFCFVQFRAAKKTFIRVVLLKVPRLFSVTFITIWSTFVNFLWQQLTWLVEAFEKFDKNKDGSLGLKEVQRLVEALNVNMSPGQVKKKFKVRKQKHFNQVG